MPVHAAIACWTASSICPRRGPTTARGEQAGISRTRTLQTKPTLAKQMLERTMEAKLPFRWVTGDSLYGDDRRLRRWLEEQQLAYVLAGFSQGYLWGGWGQGDVKK